MTPRLRIRLATVDDARAIGVLVRRGLRRDVLPDQTAEAGAYLMKTMSARAERQRILAGHRYHLAEIGGDFVGVIATRNDRHIFRLFVTRRFQRRGIARALLRAALADCRRRAGTRKFTLNASACAIPAYLRMGFVRAGRRRRKGRAAWSRRRWSTNAEKRPSRAAIGRPGIIEVWDPGSIMAGQQREVTFRFLAEPTDVNFGGKVHGGMVMKWIDQAGYACAVGWSGLIA